MVSERWGMMEILGQALGPHSSGVTITLHCETCRFGSQK